MTPSTPYDPEVESLWRKIDAAGVRSVAVVCSRPGEGTTSIVSALARRAASSGTSVLLVDLNLSRPGLARSFNAFGRQDEIVTLPDASIGVLGDISHENVSVWREPAVLAAQVRQWAAEWDLVIFDATPVLSLLAGSVPGTAVAAAAEATVLVALAGVTPIPVIRDAWNRLEGAGAHLLGTVLNDRDNPSLLAELERETFRLSRWLPGAMAALRRRLQRATLLSVRV